jgi:hypothetical protein
MGQALVRNEDAQTWNALAAGMVITRSVQGFTYPGLMDYPVTITGADDVKIVFGGQHTFSASSTAASSAA